jgi:hypothetical protein
VSFTCALAEACAGHDAICAKTDAFWHHYLTQVSASSSQSDRCIAVHRSLDELVAHLGLQETDLEVHRAALVEELERGLHHPDGVTCQQSWTKPARRVADDRATEAERLST